VLRALCAPPLVPTVISRGAPRQTTWETSVSEGRNWARNGRSIWLQFRLPRKLQGSFTCHKPVTWDRRLYFPSEGRHAVDFFARKIRRLRPGLNPWSWVPEASMLATRPPKPLCSPYSIVTKNSFEHLMLFLCNSPRFAAKLNAITLFLEISNQKIAIHM
jgi:hypothetical protein